MKKTLFQWVSACCIAVCAVGVVSISGCGGPGSTPTGEATAVDDGDITEEEEEGEEVSDDDGGDEGGDE